MEFDSKPLCEPYYAVLDGNLFPHLGTLVLAKHFENAAFVCITLLSEAFLD